MSSSMLSIIKLVHAIKFRKQLVDDAVTDAGTASARSSLLTDSV